MCSSNTWNVFVTIINHSNNKGVIICLKLSNLNTFKHIVFLKSFKYGTFCWDILSLLAFRSHFCFPWEGQRKDIVLDAFCRKHLVYWGKKTSAHPEWHFELCLSSHDLLFYCNGTALQPVPAYWVLRLSPLQFKQVWHSDKLFSFVLGHKWRSPKM